MWFCNWFSYSVLLGLSSAYLRFGAFQNAYRASVGRSERQVFLDFASRNGTGAGMGVVAFQVWFNSVGNVTQCQRFLNPAHTSSGFRSVMPASLNTVAASKSKIRIIPKSSLLA